MVVLIPTQLKRNLLRTFRKTGIFEFVIKCDTLDVTDFYTDFEINISYSGKDSSSHVFPYTTKNGLFAFPASGSILFPVNTDFSVVSIDGLRDDSVVVTIKGLPGNILDFESLETLDLESENADCEIIDGKLNARPRYIYRARKRL